MKLTLSPVRRAGPARLMSVAGDVLSVGDTDYDLSAVPEGGEATANEGPFVGPIRRVGGVIEAQVSVDIGDDAIIPMPDPGPWSVSVEAGEVVTPYARKKL